jgi:putative NIF3 family GTP cyclohydrolase 1 type 2
MDLAEAALRRGAQVLITADIRYHEAQDALSKGLCLIDAGHFGTEFPVLKKVQAYLSGCSRKYAWDCRFDTALRQSEIWRSI